MTKFYQLKDIYGNKISREQSNALRLYFREIYDEGMLKRRYLIEDKNIRHVHHYQDPGEDIHSLLQEYKTCKVSFYRISYEGSYQIQEIDLYDNGIITEKTKTVSSRNQIICYYSIDIVSGNEIPQETKKYCHMYDGSTCIFSYNNEGQCVTIDIKDQHSHVDLPITAFTSQEKEYYQSSRPCIPSWKMLTNICES